MAPEKPEADIGVAVGKVRAAFPEGAVTPDKEEAGACLRSGTYTKTNKKG
jgi:hypothetical protein